MRPPEICPNCGADVPANAKACTECGACDETGWSEAAETGGLDLPGEEFDYDDFVKREFGEGQAKPRGIAWFWWLIAVVIAAIFLALLFR